MDKVDLDGIDHEVFFEKPLIKFERLLETYRANVPRGFQSLRMAILLWVKGKLFEYMIFEKAVATPALPPITTVIDNERDGLVFTPGD